MPWFLRSKGPPLELDHTFKALEIPPINAQLPSSNVEPWGVNSRVLEHSNPD
jgi:hypothetical protein